MVVEMLSGCGCGVVIAAVAAVATRIQHRMPRLRPRAPSTPAELAIPGFVIY